MPTGLFSDSAIKDIQEQEDKLFIKHVESAIIESAKFNATTLPSAWATGKTVGIDYSLPSTTIITGTVGTTFTTYPPAYRNGLSFKRIEISYINSGGFVGYSQSQGMTSLLPDLGLEPGEDMEDALAEFREWRRAKKERITDPLRHEFSRYVEA